MMSQFFFVKFGASTLSYTHKKVLHWTEVPELDYYYMLGYFYMKVRLMNVFYWHVQFSLASNPDLQYSSSSSLRASLPFINMV